MAECTHDGLTATNGSGCMWCVKCGEELVDIASPTPIAITTNDPEIDRRLRALGIAAATTHIDPVPDDHNGGFKRSGRAYETNWERAVQVRAKWLLGLARVDEGEW